MRGIARRFRPRLRRVATIAVALAASGVGGCRSVAGFVSSFDVAPNGLQRQEYELRRGLMTGSYDSVLHRVTARKSEARPDDRLLRGLYGGLAAYYAGDFARASSALNRASEIAEDRYTRSLSRGATSLVTNDRALAYSPARTEWLFAHYYAMLAYVRRDDIREAAVEARRMSALLERFAEDSSRIDRPTFATLHYLAGAVFEMDGDVTDADVSYRNAAALSGLSVSQPSMSTDSGDVLVIVERGFVAHRVERSVNVGIDSNDVTIFGGDHHGRRHGRHHDDDRPGIWTSIKDGVRSAGSKGVTDAGGTIPSPKTGAPLPAPTDKTPAKPDRPAKTPTTAADAPKTDPIPPIARVAADTGDQRDDAAISRALTMRIRGSIDDPATCSDGDRNDGFSIGSGYFLRVAWPAYRMPVSSGPLSVQIGDRLVPMSWITSISGAVVAEYRRELPMVLARATTRAAVKYGATRLAEKKGGKVAGVMTDGVGALLERADTRSWHLLPDDVLVARIRLPAGQHTVSLAGSGGRLYAMDVTVRPGAITLATTRLWGTDSRSFGRR